MNPRPDPFAAPKPGEILLPRAPLVRVLAQLRFPTLIAIEDPRFVAPIQEALRASYPILKRVRGQGVLLESLAEPSATVKPFTEWHFADADDAWGVTLTPDFVSLQTTAYQSHGDFLARLDAVLAPIAELVHPSHIERFGVRYVNRLAGEQLKHLASFVHPEFQGITTGPVAARIEHCITETILTLAQSKMLARWGVLAPNTTVDPTTAPLTEPSWVLDLDVFRADRRAFTLDAVRQDAQEFTSHVYKFFRWAVTERFLQECGGKT